MLPPAPMLADLTLDQTAFIDKHDCLDTSTGGQNTVV